MWVPVYGIQQWTAVICLAALVAALAQTLIPAGSMERMGKFVVGAFIICVMIAPVSKIVPQISSGMQSA
ncbi:stage III sporulation protein AF, partial [Mycobacteroides abscessus subsp. massiliense]|uniref:stage III sporulation protein AF n=1 Tax=Mycobacteroides abscessus TaxID=36809 RepID=UPI003CF767DC